MPVVPNLLPGVGLLGYGNIGREVFRLLRERPAFARVVRVARRRPRASAPAAVRRLIARTPEELIVDPDVEIVIELTGDATRARPYLLEAVRRGKPVVTANKAVLSKHWSQIMSQAARRGVPVGFEATAGGGMPVVRTMQRHIATDEVEAFAGILNGTCNFILTRMKEYVVRHLDDPQIQRRSLPLEAALAIAQRRGYAEPDPTFDLNGFDTKYKVAILANLAFGVTVDPDAIFCEGIWEPKQRIAPSDFYFFHHRRYLGGKYELKLAGVAERRAGRPALRVHPALVEASGDLADLAAVDESYNGIVIRARRLGTQFMKGLGAGPRPTAISVASDVREIAAAMRAGDNAGTPAPQPGRRVTPGDLRAVRTRGFIRSFSPDVRGVYARKLEVLARHQVSVQSVVNVKEFVYGGSMPDYIEIDSAPDEHVQRVLADLRRLPAVREPMYFRVLEL
jgi:homoserine dehydrogenase